MLGLPIIANVFRANSVAYYTRIGGNSCIIAIADIRAKYPNMESVARNIVHIGNFAYNSLRGRGRANA